MGKTFPIAVLISEHYAIFVTFTSACEFEKVLIISCIFVCFQRLITVSVGTLVDYQTVSSTNIAALSSLSWLYFDSFLYFISFWNWESDCKRAGSQRMFPNKDLSYVKMKWWATKGSITVLVCRNNLMKLD